MGTVCFPKYTQFRRVSLELRRIQAKAMKKGLDGDDEIAFLARLEDAERLAGGMAKKQKTEDTERLAGGLARKRKTIPASSDSDSDSEEEIEFL